MPTHLNQKLIESLALQLDLPSRTIEELYSAFLTNLEHCAVNIDSIAIPGFGSLAGVKSAETVRKEPETGAEILYPPCIELKFKSSVVLRKKINQ